MSALAQQHAARLSSRNCTTSGRRVQLAAAAAPARGVRRSLAVAVRAHTVALDLEGTTTVLDVPDGMSILEVALDQGLEVPHDCKMGVCMNCSAKLVGRVRTKEGLLCGVIQGPGPTKGWCSRPALCCLPTPGAGGRRGRPVCGHAQRRRQGQGLRPALRLPAPGRLQRPDNPRGGQRRLRQGGLGEHCRCWRAQAGGRQRTPKLSAPCVCLCDNHPSVYKPLYTSQNAPLQEELIDEVMNVN